MKIKTDDAVKHFNGVAGLAAALEISRAAIYQWGEFVPDTRVYQLHLLSNMALPPATGTGETSTEASGAAA